MVFVGFDSGERDLIAFRKVKLKSASCRFSLSLKVLALNEPLLSL